MSNIYPRTFFFCAAALVGLTGAAAQDVQTGIAAWQQGEYPRAVAAWRPLADAGNADAQFNLAQAYRLGRGVPQDLSLAEHWFERAARQRHDQAGASLGLLLFQNGRAREAMPWIQAAALRGDPRAQYVFGTALFNGDVVRRDLPRAFAMMSAAAGQGFPQAQAQLTEMERQLSPADRDAGRALAAQMSADTPPAQLAAATPPPLPVRAQPAPPVTPRAAPAASSGAGQAGVSYPHPAADGRPYQPPHTPPEAQPPVPIVAPRARPDRPQQQPAPVQVQTARPAETRRAAPAAGDWQVQLGAFSSAANARRQWAQLSRRVAALGPLQPSYPQAGALTRLRVGPVESRAAADRLCSAVRAAGAGCFPVR